MPKLVIKNGEKQGLTLRVVDRITTIGRDPSNTLVVPDRRVSRQHAQLAKKGDQYVLKDIGSVNGTKINDQFIEEQVLAYGDTFSVGSTIIQFLSLEASPNQSVSESASRIQMVPDEELKEGMTVSIRLDPSRSSASGDKISEAGQDILAKVYQRLLILQNVSHELGSVTDLNQLLSDILKLILDTIKAERGLIMLKDEETGELVLQAIHNKNAAGGAENIQFSRTIVRQVVEKGESVMTTDAKKDERFQNAESIIRQGIRSTLCVPIKLRDKILGLVQVDTTGAVISFSEDDLELLTAISEQAAVVIQNARLIQDLRLANQELKERQAQLIEAEKMSAIGQLASGVAHEINNPMTSILGYSQLSSQQLSKEEISEKDIQECIEFAKIVENEAKRCQQIVQGLLQFGRRKSDEKILSDINTIIEAAIMIAKFHIKKSNTEIKTDLAPDLPRVLANANQLQQVFLNLIINARDAMESGGILTISSHMADAHVELRFKDTGSGIPPALMEKIFQPLFTTKEEGKGTGLGLSITQDIIEHHQGTLDVESEVGKGTAFIIRLPKGE